MEETQEIMALEQDWRERLSSERLGKAEQVEALGFRGSVAVSWEPDEPRTLRFVWSIPDGERYESDVHDFVGIAWLEAFDQATRRALNDY